MANNQTLSGLFNEKTFYSQFIFDLKNATKEVIIESPFITVDRTVKLLPVFRQLIQKNILVYIVTRDPKEHDQDMGNQAEQVIQTFEKIGIQVILCPGNHHRKLALIDRQIVWEGSLNILSNFHSREFMRRIDENQLASDTFTFLKYDRFVV